MANKSILDGFDPQPRVSSFSLHHNNTDNSQINKL